MYIHIPHTHAQAQQPRHCAVKCRKRTCLHKYMYTHNTDTPHMQAQKPENCESAFFREPYKHALLAQLHTLMYKHNIHTHAQARQHSQWRCARAASRSAHGDSVRQAWNLEQRHRPDARSVHRMETGMCDVRRVHVRVRARFIHKSSWHAHTHTHTCTHTHTHQTQTLPEIGLQSIGLFLNGERFTAATPRQLVEAFLSWAATQPLVRWIDERETFRKFNNLAVKGVQSASGQGTPIWARGLRGEGQVVGLADTVSIHVCIHIYR
jgi:hypothetical protein